MVVIQEIVAALWQHDFAALANPHVVGVVYLVMFATLFLENGLLYQMDHAWAALHVDPAVKSEAKRS